MIVLSVPAQLLWGGVKLGDNSTIGAGTVVAKDVEKNAVVIGSSFRVLKYKNEP